MVPLLRGFFHGFSNYIIVHRTSFLVLLTAGWLLWSKALIAFCKISRSSRHESAIGWISLLIFVRRFERPLGNFWHLLTETTEFRVIFPDFLRFSALTSYSFPLSWEFFFSSTFIDPAELASPLNSSAMLSFRGSTFCQSMPRTYKRKTAPVSPEAIEWAMFDV